MNWSQIIANLAVVAYLVSGFLYIRDRLLVEANQQNKLIELLLYFGLILQTISLFSLTLSNGYLPLDNLYQLSLLLSWFLISSYLLFDYLYKVLGMEIIILSLSIILLLAVNFLEFQSKVMPRSINNFWLKVELVSILLAALLFVLSLVVALFYLIEVKNYWSAELMAVFQRLPELSKLARLNFKLLVAIFPLLTIGFIANFLWLNSIWSVEWSWNPQQVWVVVVWLGYAVYLYQRWSKRWHNQQSIYWLIGGVGVSLISYLGLTILIG
ncbi:MAG: cytochrome c biogenesis protein CcsA [Bacillota bacterium]